jgi:hypothetical protein
MYSVDERDKAIELHDAPQSSVGAPLPVVLSDQHTTVLAYVVQEVFGSSPDSLDEPPGEDFFLIKFLRCRIYMVVPQSICKCVATSRATSS